MRTTDSMHQHTLMTSFNRPINSDRRFGIMASSPPSSSTSFLGSGGLPVAAVTGIQTPSISPPIATQNTSSSATILSSSPSSSVLSSSPSSSAALFSDSQGQRTSLEQLLDRQLVEGDFWYVVVAEWLESLKKYLGISSTRKYYGQRATSPPGPVVTRRDYAHTVDVVHEDAWRMLLKWYGLAEGHKAMKLVVYKYARGPEIEHNINSFKVSLANCPPEDFHILRFSKMEKIGHVEYRVRQLYNIQEKVETRCWAKLDTDGEWRPLFFREKPIGIVLDIDSDFTRPVIVLETCDVDGHWEGLTDSPEIPNDVTVSGYLLENNLFDDVTTTWELDIHDHIDQTGKMLLEKLHANFDVFVQKGKEYLNNRENQLRERERMVCSRESVAERLAARLETKEVRLLESMEECEAKIKEYESKRLLLEREFLEREEEADRILAEKQEGMREQEEELQNRKEIFQKEIERMSEVGKIQESRIKLDIGGNQFTTSVLTLSKDPNSMLAAMFSGRHELKPEADGSYFIDRDGTHFRYILNFLRDGCLQEGSLPSSSTVYTELLSEAEFFQLDDLAEYLRGKLDQKDCG